MMKKDFQSWHRQKNIIQEKDISAVYFHERDVWYVACGANVGFEQDGKNSDFGRPVLILKKFNQHVFWGIPLTSKEKTGVHYAPISQGTPLPSFAILSQMRLFDAKRLVNHVGRITQNDFLFIKEKIRSLIDS